MTDYPKRTPARRPTHPGVLLAEIIPATGKSETEIAELLGIPNHDLDDITRERKPVSAELANRLGKLLGGSAASWIKMQAAYDSWQAPANLRS